MPLKTIVSPISEPEMFSAACEAAMQKIQEEFLFFSRKHVGKPAEVSRSVTFHVTETKLVCILYYSWSLAEKGVILPPLGVRVPPGSRTQ